MPTPEDYMGTGSPFMAMAGDPTEPLFLRMTQHMPGLTASILHSSRRGSNTLMRGGYLDDMSASGSRLGARRAARYNTVNRSGQVSSANAKQFIGRRRGARLASEGKYGLARSMRVNNLTGRPRALGRYHSLSVFSNKTIGVPGMGAMYTPMGGGFVGNLGPVKSRLTSTMGLSDEALKGAQFGPGMLSFMTAGVRADALERRALSGSTRAAAKLSKMDDSLRALYGMNVGSATLGPADDVATMINRSVGNAAGMTNVGARGNMLASAAPGIILQDKLGYMRGAAGFRNAGNLTGQAAAGAARAAEDLATAIGRNGIVGRGGTTITSNMADDILQKGLLKNLGTTGVSEVAKSAAGRKVLMARYAPRALAPLQVLGTASLAYDLGKMAGEVVKSGINLAKDAATSLQGSINKPMFGMGYKDTESAATSRARGVMAIQNSRLNARSVLGSEAGMMAARFG